MTSYITLEEALRIHEVLIDAFGGAHGVRDMGLLESALLRPQTGYYGDLIEEAAALWESLAMNHPFVDGNKRVAYAVVELFLQSNGLDILPDDKTIETFIYHHLDAGTFRKDILDAWLRDNTEPL
ncbi:MAG: type II toxin-antitoxin system death-on-curing family toxin [Devosia nanyangense]|uniref:Type II toxin-antitoxin system death-on-curing family toxin n=1 Tax=Devosia nanyangense TaxID=1228055 RepID=A0A933NZH8_9HYPH|nr:type II toxin-antitoxin system death-on-curing family toxin [Devosia nanyangense]